MEDTKSLLLIAYFALTSFLIVVSFLKLNNLKKNIKEINSITKHTDLNTFLGELAASNKNIMQQQEQIQKTYSDLRIIAQKSLQKTALIRFNPFKDTGGDQSFVLCILDHTDTGFIVTAIHSRDGTRIYTKDIINGTAKLSLSVEEKKALANAIRSR